MIFYNRFTGFCVYSNIFSNDNLSEEQNRKENDFFLPEGILEKVINDKITIIRYEGEKNVFEIDLNRINVSDIDRVQKELQIYIPLFFPSKKISIQGILKIRCLKPRLENELEFYEWINLIKIIGRTFSSLIKRRKFVQGIRVIDDLGKISPSGNIEKIYNILTNKFSYLFQCPTALWVFSNRDTSELKISYASNWFHQSNKGRDYIENTKIVLKNNNLDERITKIKKEKTTYIELRCDEVSNFEALKTLGVKSVILTPIHFKEDILGIVALYKLSNESLDNIESQLLDNISQQASQIIQNERSIIFNKLIQDTIHEFFDLIAGNPEDIFKLITKKGQEYFGADQTQLYIFNDYDSSLEKYAEFPEDSEQNESPLTEKGVRFLSKKEKIDHLIFSNNNSSNFADLVKKDFGAYAFLPILSQGSLKGVLLVFHKEKRAFLNEYSTLLRVYPLFAGLMLNIFSSREELRKNSIQTERMRLSSELHNSIADLILAIKNYAEGQLNLLNKTEDYDNKLYSVFNQIENISIEAYDRVKNLSRDINSIDFSQILEYGLIGSLEKFFLTLNSDIKIEFDSIGEIDILPINFAILILRFSKLALSNISKHSRAQSAKYQIKLKDKKVRITISDNGIGFNPDIIPKGCLGIENMNRLIEKSNGQLILNSGPNRGTQIKCFIPLVVRGD